MKLNLALLLSLVALTGCSGVMYGMVRGDGKPVQVHYTQEMSSDKLTLTMPDGEIFTGKAVMTGNSTTISMGNAQATAHYSDGTHASAQGSSYGVSNTYTGNVRAILFGNRGRTIECALNYADTTGITNAGGVGVCKTSDGLTLDIQW